jgi:hypothetical protein
MATVAAVANGFGTDGWLLTDLVSAHHNTYLLTFEPAPAQNDAPDLQKPDTAGGATTHLG